MAARAQREVRTWRSGDLVRVEATAMGGWWHAVAETGGG